MPYNYSYSGTIYRETRKFRAFRNAVLKNVFAAGPWKNIICTDDGRVDMIFQASDFTQNVRCENVSITIQDGNDRTVLKGGVYTNLNSQGELVILFLSGSGGPLNEYALPVLKGYLGIPSVRSRIKSVIGIDYRGFGLSRSNPYQRSSNYQPTGPYLPGSRAIYTDASAMIEFATAATSNGGLGVDPGNLILHGFSLGSGPATEMSKLGKPHGGLILHGPMKSISHESASAVGVIGIAQLAGAVAQGNVGFKNIDKMKDIPVPVLITSGPNDSMWTGAKDLWKKLKKHKKNVRFAVHDGDHLNTGAIFQNTPSTYNQRKYGGDSARKLLNDFLAEVDG